MERNDHSNSLYLKSIQKKSPNEKSFLLVLLLLNLLKCIARNRNKERLKHLPEHYRYDLIKELVRFPWENQITKGKNKVDTFTRNVT